MTHASSSLTPRDPLERGAQVSDHPYPRGLLRGLTALAVALSLIGAAVGVLGLLVMAVGYGLPLLIPMAGCLAMLAVPLLLLTVLHPAVTVYEQGVWLHPLLWRGVWLPWSAVKRLEPHTLIRRGTTRPGQRELTGQLVVADGLPPLFLIVGLMAGLGRVRAFGIASHSHRDYPRLLNAFQKHKSHH